MGDHNVFYTNECLFVFGWNFFGQLGLGDRKTRSEPTKLEFFQNSSNGLWGSGDLALGKDLEILSISCGCYHTIINTTDGLFVAGLNLYGQLGLGDTNDRIELTNLKFEHEIISIYCGDHHTIINTTDGIFVFGYNNHGQLGLGNTEYKNVPTKLEFFQRAPYGVGGCHPFTTDLALGKALEIISIHCGGDHTIINTIDGLFVFGSNNFGQLGLGNNRNDILKPKKLEFFNDVLEIISIHCGNAFTMIHTTDGLFVFGCNSSGQLGLNDRNERLIPTKLVFENKTLEILSIHCGFSHTIINTTDGLFVLGSNKFGQLGLGDTKDRLVPTKLDFESLIDPGCSLGETLEIISVHCGFGHTIINTTEGIFVFGSNYNGQLGLGDKSDQKYPTKLNFNHEIIPFNKKKTNQIFIIIY